jgi:hypothetical protein
MMRRDTDMGIGDMQKGKRFSPCGDAEKEDSTKPNYPFPHRLVPLSACDVRTADSSPAR